MTGRMKWGVVSRDASRVEVTGAGGGVEMTGIVEWE